MFDQITIVGKHIPTGFIIQFTLGPDVTVKDALPILAKYQIAPTLANDDVKNKEKIIVFPASEMTATVDKGKVYWKVTGAKYTKHGATIWPEVLETAGFNPDELNPMKPYDLKGYMAYCEPNGSGNPKKVIRLEAMH